MAPTTVEQTGKVLKGGMLLCAFGMLVGTGACLQGKDGMDFGIPLFMGAAFLLVVLRVIAWWEHG